MKRKADLTLNERLAALRITHCKTGRGYEHEYRRDGVVLFTGSVSQAWVWVEAGCP